MRQETGEVGRIHGDQATLSLTTWLVRCIFPVLSQCLELLANGGARTGKAELHMRNVSRHLPALGFAWPGSHSITLTLSRYAKAISNT